MGLVNIYITYNILMSKEIRDINCYHEDEFIEFINGYNKDARRMITKYEGFTKKKDLFLINVGKIIK